ncbi:PxORF33 peptide [Plutella xylostella granulovirus]|uniref:ORF33 protein n=1 Tax=Plutella xylostella granulovirus TaxID=98383 RepID=Q9DVZ9_9BBAC|nr:PxORF33 peptide [Plutella xylostella granulovirus]AAG27331.1 PxORF33 peptide [Plutella xylostella granulovirus]AMQ35645.1 PxGV-Corf33 protein [Plutella xylostella granulovirus]AMQ35762.1 PxGV-Korf33 protein [Plutella xylostella granulovirus]AMQ35879.1 PxGV-Morf33 protein [Plutella xylostella granulovirus]AMQ35996.1 PxGV-Torf33 protein [Plutella xylostella granulovirus]
MIALHYCRQPHYIKHNFRVYLSNDIYIICRGLPLNVIQYANDNLLTNLLFESNHDCVYDLSSTGPYLCLKVIVSRDYKRVLRDEINRVINVYDDVIL